MVLKQDIRETLKKQISDLNKKESGIKREILKKIDLDVPHAIIVSGIRRCGKSTLLHQLMKKSVYYFNFEDPRVLSFKVSDFEKLKEIFIEVFGEKKIYFLDEIQNVPNWEVFVRSEMDSGKKFVITGSNATLLSKELGTRLTGRYLRYELYPFSYKEFLQFTKKKASKDSLRKYMEKGGFPEYLKYDNSDILRDLLDSVITRDVLVRNNIREADQVKKICIYLLSNIGKQFSLNKLTKHFGIGSVNTVRSYISFFEDSYLLFTVPKFDYSFKKQIVNPKKIYSIDVGLSTANSISFSKDKGRILENLVFLHLKRKYDEIFYYKNKSECDFVVKDKDKILFCVQVCFIVNEDNKMRESNGLKEAMQDLNVKKGFIITFDQEDIIDDIPLIPAWRWFST
ncbi:AAA family ATPase [archaeon]|nr:AAA family ATPase [archaeon]